MKFLLRPAPEVTIKSKPVRRRHMRLLRQNIRKLLRSLNPAISVEGTWDRVTVTGPDEPGQEAAILDLLQRTPGLSVIQRVATFQLTTLVDLVERVRAAFKVELSGRTFAVRVRRHGEHEFRSLDVARRVGQDLLANTGAVGVNLDGPEVIVRIEVAGEQVSVVQRRYPGLGGYPLGSVDSVMTLVSGGYDSTVAAYQMLRRGVRSHYLFFNLGGMAHETGVRQVVHYLWQRYGASHSARFISVPFDGVVAEIMRSVNHRHWGVVLKRQMLRAASEIAALNNTDSLVTGDAVAQVSSQTLANLAVIDQASEVMVLRPLIAMDKESIIDLARTIGTEPFARTMPEYCGVISDRPVTRANRHRIEKDETGLNPSVLRQAIEDRRECPVSELMASTVTPEEVELVRTPAVDDVIIDVRHPVDGERAPLKLTGNQVLCIPFYELGQAVVSLPKGRQYLLYCDRGTISRLHAGHLRAGGHDNIKVYAPE